nr:MAG TPA: hypothetical protein [Caudoviricetes sp.]
MLKVSVSTKVRCIVNFLTVVRILPLSRQTLSHKFSD